jgi:hypothetical protein
MIGMMVGDENMCKPPPGFGKRGLRRFCIASINTGCLTGVAAM